MASMILPIPFPNPTFRPPLYPCRVIAIPRFRPIPLKKEYDPCPESLNGFKFKLIGQLVLNEGEEMALPDLCDNLHSIWQPSMTWRVIPVGGQGYYSLQFSCYQDLMKVAAAPSYPLRCGSIRLVEDCGQLDVKSTSPTATLVRWHRPLPSWVKVNTDGSSFGSSSSCGGVFRDHRGNMMSCFTMKLGEGTAFEAELAACINAIDIASAEGWKKLWLESDCTRVVELLYARSTDVPAKYAEAWTRVLGHLQQMELRVTHIYREGNRVADALASPDTQMSLVSELLYEDTIDIVNLRLK